jgi:hypothetical protein
VGEGREAGISTVGVGWGRTGEEGWQGKGELCCRTQSSQELMQTLETLCSRQCCRQSRPLLQTVLHRALWFALNIKLVVGVE